MDREAKLLKQFLETERGMGADEIPEEFMGPPSVPASAGGEDAWEELAARARVCRVCRLCETRTKVVFGEGRLNARIMFIGEAPGHEEDIEGRPFVGKAGKLLDKIIEAMGLARGDVYIANCVKCRPPQNRNPLPDEIAACRPYLNAQIERIRPEVICALGKFAAQTLLATETPISRMRGIFRDYHGIPLMPTFHPAYILRNEADKKYVWQDMKSILEKLNLPVPPPRTR